MITKIYTTILVLFASFTWLSGQTITLGVNSPINEDGGISTITATASPVPSGFDITVTIGVNGSSTATGGGTDYTLSSTTITILDGNPSGTVTVTSVSDTFLEGDETVIIDFSSADNGYTESGGGGAQQKTITITDDETLTDFITAPVNGLTGVSVEPTIEWTDQAGDALGYDVYFSTSGSSQTDFESNIFASTVLDPLPIPDIVADETSFAWQEIHASIPLNHSTLYYVQVIAHQDADVDNYSTIHHFTTVPVVTITHTSPNNGGLVYSTTPALYWYPSTLTGTMKYKVQLIRDELLAAPGNPPTEAEWTTSTSYTTTNLYQTVSVLAGKVYWWRVIVLNSSDEVINYSTPWSFTVIGGVGITIYQSWPIGNPTVYTYTPYVYWFSDQLALGVTYTVWYNTAGDTDFSGYIDSGDAGALSVAAGTDIFAQLPALTGGTTYYWSVEGTYNAESTYSGIETFTTYDAQPLIVPIATYPIGGMTVYTTSPDVYYYTGYDISGLYFDLDLSITSGGQDGNADFSTATPGLYYIQLTGLTPGQTYYYKLRSKSVVGVPGVGESSAWSGEYSFMVIGGITGGYPVLTWPIGGASVYTIRPSLYWYLEGSSLGLTGYTLKYTNDPAAAGWNSAAWESFNPGLVIDNTDGEVAIGSISTLSYTFTTDLDYGTIYYWAVASTDGVTESTYAAGSFNVYGQVISAPTLTLPNNGTTIAQRSPTLYWYITDNAGFLSYTLVYSTSDVFAAPVTTTVPGITNSFYALSNLTPGATYYWYVTAVYSQGDATSSTWTFTVDPGALSVQPLIGSPNNVNINTVSPLLSWVIPVPSQSQLIYHLEVAESSDFINPMIFENLQSPYQVVNGLQEGKDYFWRVRSSTPSGNVSYYSGTGKFRVISGNITDVGDSDALPTQFTVSQNYPNPFNPSTVINYSLPTASFVAIKVYDMLGREVRTLLSADMPAGVHNVTWNGDDAFGRKVSSGTYIYRVLAGGNTAVKKMVLLK